MDVFIDADEVIASISRCGLLTMMISKMLHILLALLNTYRLENLNMDVGHRSILALYCANYDSL